MLLYLECYTNSLSKGVNILLGQPDSLSFIFTKSNYHDATLMWAVTYVGTVYKVGTIKKETKAKTGRLGFLDPVQKNSVCISFIAAEFIIINLVS